MLIIHNNLGQEIWNLRQSLSPPVTKIIPNCDSTCAAFVTTCPCRSPSPPSAARGRLSKMSEGYFRFLCPRCGEMRATVNPRNNLAHCFCCQKNLNNIDLLITLGYDFRPPWRCWNAGSTNTRPSKPKARNARPAGRP